MTHTELTHFLQGLALSMRVSIQAPNHYCDKASVRFPLNQTWIYIAGTVLQFDELQPGDVAVLGDDGTTYSFWKATGKDTISDPENPVYLVPLQCDRHSPVQKIWSNSSAHPDATSPINH